MTQKAVLMLAYGTPASVERMRCYLSDIRGGRPMSEEFVNEFKRRYTLIGGSPLTGLTYDQAQKTGAELKRRGHNLPVYLGMRHWSPWIKDAVGHMMLHGIQEAVAIVLAPHYSKMSVGKYWDKIEEAQAIHNTAINFTFINSWYRQPKFLAALEANVRAGLAKFPVNERDGVKVIFSAHSLPERLKKMGDPYDDQLQDNAQLVAGRLGHIDWMFSYQSAAHTGEPWLGPQLEDVVVELARSGYKNALVVPIGFVCDHVEILYDIDIEARQLAQENGLRLERTESMNSNPLFIEALADAILEKLD